MTATEAEQRTIEACRRERLSLATERDYAGCVRRFVEWLSTNSGCQSLCPEDRVCEYLSQRAPHISASTQNQSLHALLLFYRAVLKQPLGRLPAWARAERPRRLPDWLPDADVRRVLALLRDEVHLGCSMMYGSGLRVNEAAGLRWRAINYEHLAITIRAGKGDKDRTVPLPVSLVEELRRQEQHALALWHEDRAVGRPGVQIPDAVAHKSPRAGEDFGMFWVFPAAGLSRDPRSGIVRRHHLIDDTFANALRRAVRRSGITKKITPHCLRHSFATEYLLQGGAIHELKELLGHASIQTTEIYLHCLPALGARVRSPLDREPTNIVRLAAPAAEPATNRMRCLP
ncbi:MAG: integron integrase [Chthoniobacteraceae bacterium]